MRRFKVWTCGHYTYRLKETVNRLSQFTITIGHHPAGIMGVQLDAHIAVLIVESGMVGLLFREEGDARHEGEGFLEILEAEFPDEAVVLFKPHGGRAFGANVVRLR